MSLLLPLKVVYRLSKELALYLPSSHFESAIEEQEANVNKYYRRQKARDGEHWAIYGKTGMGKTTLIKALIDMMYETYPYNVYHLDTKHQGDFSARDGKIIVSEFAPPVFSTWGNKMVWQPLLDIKEEYSKFFTNILNAGVPSIVNVDESANLVFGTDVPRGLMLLLKQGRMPGINVILGAQEIANSVRQALSQATHVVSFNLINSYDTIMMRKYLRLPKELQQLNLKKYQLLHIKPDYDSTATLYNSYKELLGKVRI